MLKPTTDWILTKPVAQKEKVTDSGIVLVTKEEDSTKLVEIVSFGPGANKDSSLKAGDIVMVPTQTGYKVEFDGEAFEMAKEQNFLGVIE